MNTVHVPLTADVGVLALWGMGDSDPRCVGAGGCTDTASFGDAVVGDATIAGAGCGGAVGDGN